MEDLSIDNILQEDELENLFIDDDESSSNNENIDSNNENNLDSDNKEDNKSEEETTEEVNVDELFTDKTPESVGSGKEENKEKEGTNSLQDKSTSPKQNNFYSSIAQALKEEGVFPDLTDEDIKSIVNPEDFVNIAIEKQIQSKLDERQKRINEALNANVEPTTIQKFENTIKYLNSINDKDLSAETSNGEDLRRQLIFQDYINRGFSKERAQKEVKRSFDLGNDIEDAKEALSSNKDYFKSEYNKIIKESKEEESRELKNRQEQIETLKKSIFEDNKVFGEINIDNNTKQQIFDNISKPVYKDPNTGEYLTAIQKYEKENRIDFLKNVSLLYTLTDGFKDLNKLVKDKLKKETKKGIRELENVINNTSRTFDGNLKYATGSYGNEDNESFISKGWDIDI